MAAAPGSAEEAETQLVMAQKKASSGGGFMGMFTRPEAKFEEAYELCQSAANSFKLAKKWDRAAAAFIQGAEMQEKLKVNHEAATCYVEAAKMLKKVDSRGSIAPLLKAIEKFAQMSRFQFAAKHSMAIAETYETELSDLDSALEYYEKAIDYAQMDGTDATTINKASAKIATISAQLERYDRAMELFEQTGMTMVENALLKFSCKEYFLKAGLCRILSGDVPGAKVKLDSYETQAAYFRDSREANLLRGVLKAVEEEDVDEFTHVVKEFDALSPLDGWMTQMLLRIKKTISGDDVK